jgi:hypothetical protein
MADDAVVRTGKRERYRQTVVSTVAVLTWGSRGCA